jgi:hypothetical protein
MRQRDANHREPRARVKPAQWLADQRATVSSIIGGLGWVIALLHGTTGAKLAQAKHREANNGRRRYLVRTDLVRRASRNAFGRTARCTNAWGTDPKANCTAGRLRIFCWHNAVLGIAFATLHSCGGR